MKRYTVDNVFTLFNKIFKMGPYRRTRDYFGVGTRPSEVSIRRMVHSFDIQNLNIKILARRILKKI